MADMDKIKDRLASLLARARDAGSSDAEVAACMTKAQKLMEEHGVSEEDLKDVENLSFRSFEYAVAEGRKNHEPVLRYCAPYVGKMTGVTFYIEGYSKKIITFGLEADVEYATWLITSLRQFLDDQWRHYKCWELGDCSRLKLREARIGFVRGFCNRINERIKEMTYRSEEGTGVGTGTDLVAKKNDVIVSELAKRGIHLGGGASLRGNGKASQQAQGAGYVAGGGASLGRGVGQNSIAIGKS